MENEIINSDVQNNNKTDAHEQIGKEKETEKEQISPEKNLIPIPDEKKHQEIIRGDVITASQSTFAKLKTLELKRTETLSKLDSLKQLYEQGYLTHNEFKERKAQLVDSLTGTKSVSQLEKNPNQERVFFKQKYAPPKPPDFSKVQAEKAIKYTYDPKTGIWGKSMIQIKVETEPFARGGLRAAYHMTPVDGDVIEEEEETTSSTTNEKKILKNSPKEPEAVPLLSGNPGSPHPGPTHVVDDIKSKYAYVAKTSIDPFEDREIYFSDVEMQMFAKEWADRFNFYNPPKKVTFVKAAVLELFEREGKPLCGVEKFIYGPYLKHNNNYGAISEDDRNTPQAFSHFTYEASGHTILICDIQGVGDCYTDPQVHTIDGMGFGKGNLGKKGFERFLATHRCSAICKYLNLPLINAKDLDVGTVPIGNITRVKHVSKVDVYEYSYDPNHPNSVSQPLIPSKRRVVPAHDDSCCCVIS